MQARVKQSSRYGSANLFSGSEFVKFEWRKVPAAYEDQARTSDLLEIREGKAEKEVVEKQVQEQAKPVMKARLVADYRYESLRTFGDHEYTKTGWREVPEGFESSARLHELLEVWEPGADEPKQAEEPKQKADRKHTHQRKNKSSVIEDEEGKA